jgi:hypothetical protein
MNIIRKLLLVALLVTAFQVALGPSKGNLHMGAGGSKGAEVPVTPNLWAGGHHISEAPLIAS